MYNMPPDEFDGVTSKGYEVFLEGQEVDLCIPNEADMSTWASWFNRCGLTTYLEHGEFPTTVETQRLFYANALTSRERILLMIKSKHARLLGVASLSKIDLKNRRAEIATVIGSACRTVRFAAIEARCLSVTHAFDNIGLEVISGALAYPGNKKWLIKNMAIGFKPEGLLIGRISKQRVRYDLMSYSMTYEEYSRLVSERGGSIWPGAVEMGRMLTDDSYERNIDLFYSACKKLRG